MKLRIERNRFEECTLSLVEGDGVIVLLAERDTRQGPVTDEILGIMKDGRIYRRKNVNTRLGFPQDGFGRVEFVE